MISVLKIVVEELIKIILSVMNVLQNTPLMELMKLNVHHLPLMLTAGCCHPLGVRNAKCPIFSTVKCAP